MPPYAGAVVDARAAEGVGPYEGCGANARAAEGVGPYEGCGANAPRYKANGACVLPGGASPSPTDSVRVRS